VRLSATPEAPASVRPGAGGRALPESPARKQLIHGLALAALVASTAYLAWRAAATLDLSGWYVALPLLGLEIHHAAGIALYTFALWDVDPLPGWHRVETTPLRVAILIPTYDEAEEVLLPVVAAAVAVSPNHETWVLDDGHRPQVESMARSLGAHYLSRADNRDAKAGNLNAALRVIEADLVAVLDADHVVRPDFLHHTLCYFDDPKVAVVQTPQDFYNTDSFEHDRRRGRRFNEEAVFYRVILPAKNRWNAVFWCGTNAVVRVAALRDVGGVATGTVTEDIHTSIRLHRRGWRIVAHNEVLALGLAAADLNQYVLQRRRWARGAMQVMRAEHPITGPGLTPAQRLAYASTLFGWFDVWRSLGYLLLPMLVLVTGGLAIAVPFTVFGPVFLATFLLQFTAFRFLSRGYYPPLLATIFETLRMPAVLPATLELVHHGEKRFRVTPKGRVSSQRRRVPPPRLLFVLFGLGVATLGWFGLTLVGMTPLHYGEPAAMYGSAGFLLMNLALLIAAAARAMAARFAGERRAGVRFITDLPAKLDGVPARVEDVSLGGARLLLEGSCPWVEPDERGRLFLDTCPEGLEVTVARVYSRTPAATEAGVSFGTGQEPALARLALFLFHGLRQASEVAQAA
jgi:cellulose synthase/poly-beta-1,6-N-acetylglucosamine synthase-like glycosyltransferase